MSRVALWNVTIHGLLAVAMMGMAVSFPAQAGSKTVLQGKLVTCPDAAGMFCLQRADGKGTVTLLNVSEEVPMYFMRDLDTLTTMEIDVAVEGALKSPTAYAANEGLKVRWGKKEAELPPDSVHPSSEYAVDEAPPAAQVPEMTMKELGQLVADNQARAVALYGSAPGFRVKGKALAVSVETNQAGERFAAVLVSSTEVNIHYPAFGIQEKARVVCYTDMASGSRINPGQIVTVSGVIHSVERIAVRLTYTNDLHRPYMVASAPCSVSVSP